MPNASTIFNGSTQRTKSASSSVPASGQNRHTATQRAVSALVADISEGRHRWSRASAAHTCSLGQSSQAGRFHAVRKGGAHRMRGGLGSGAAATDAVLQGPSRPPTAARFSMAAFPTRACSTTLHTSSDKDRHNLIKYAVDTVAKELGDNFRGALQGNRILGGLHRRHWRQVNTHKK